MRNTKGIELAQKAVRTAKQVIATNKALIECYESNDDYASVVQAMIRIEAWEGHLEQAEGQLAKCLEQANS